MLQGKTFVGYGGSGRVIKTILVVFFLAIISCTTSGCAFLYYRDNIVVALPGKVEIPLEGDYEKALAGQEFTLEGLIFDLQRHDTGNEGAEFLSRCFRDAQVTLYMVTGGKAHYAQVLKKLVHIVFATRTGISPATATDLAAVFDGRNRECLALTTVYLIVGRRSGLSLYPVLTRGHIMVLYDDGVNKMYVDVARNVLNEDEKDLSLTQFGATTAPKPYLRPLNDRELGGVILANRALDLKDDDDALKNARAAAVLFPGFPGAWVNIGVFFEKRADWRGADEAYEKALAIDPGNEFAINDLAQLMMNPDAKDMYNAQKALSMLENFVAIRKDVPLFIKSSLKKAQRLCEISVRDGKSE